MMQPISAGKIKGIDVSRHNGLVDWAKVKGAGYSFVYAKASEGVTYDDPLYLQHVKGAKAAGLAVGAYHFARPENNAAIDEAKHFVDILKKFDTDLIPVLDLEMPTNPKLISSQKLVQWARDFINYVQKETGRKVMLYTGVWFIKRYDNFFNKLSDVPLWVSLYGSSVPDVGGWSRWVVWQYTDKGQVPGVSGNCDVNVAVSLDEILDKQIVAKPSIPASKPAPKPAPPQYPLPTGVLKLGSRGEAVKQLQRALTALNFKCGAVDGVYGAQTKDAVLRFQKAYHLQPYDGIYGVKTRAEMVKHLR